MQKQLAFFGGFPKKTFEKGEVLLRPGDTPKDVYFILSGTVRQYDINQQGEEVVVNVFRTPAFFPMTWIINGTDNVYFYDCFEPVEAHKVPAQKALEFIQQNPDVMFDLLKRVLAGATVLQRRMAHLMGGNGHTRVLFELLVESRRFGEPTGNGGYILAIREEELAKRAGLSRETLNRELSKLKAKGLLKVEHKQLHIFDLGALEELLDGSL